MMETSEQTTLTDHSSEVVEASPNPDEVLELEDDLTAILRSKDALIKQKGIENHIQASMLKQKDEAILKLKRALKLARDQFTSIYLFSNAAYFTNLSTEGLKSVLCVFEILAADAATDCGKALNSDSTATDENSNSNREG